jgi:hypothetical protein
MTETGQQTGIYLEAPHIARHEIAVPAPPAEFELLDPAAYGHLLPTSPAECLTSRIVPISTKMGKGNLVIIFDARGNRAQSFLQNEQATKFTASLTTGFGLPIYGPAIVFHVEPGKDFTMHHFNALDDIIQGPFFDTFGNGEVPGEGFYALYRRIM